jgi:hypothetical protein
MIDYITHHTEDLINAMMLVKPLFKSYHFYIVKYIAWFIPGIPREICAKVLEHTFILLFTDFRHSKFTKT